MFDACQCKRELVTFNAIILKKEIQAFAAKNSFTRFGFFQFIHLKDIERTDQMLVCPSYDVHFDSDFGVSDDNFSIRML